MHATNLRLFDMNNKSIRLILPVILLIIGFLYLTRYQLSFVDAIDWVHATDVYSYLVISSSAPNFPAENIPFHFSQRWIPHYLVGYLASFFGIDLEVTYSLVNIVFIIFMLRLMWGIVFQVAPDKAIGGVIFLFLALSVFSFRLYVFVPGLFADLVYVLGLLIAINGCILKRFGFIVLGMLVATIGKQLSLLVLPGFALYVFVVWGHVVGRTKSFLMGVLLSLVVVGFYLLLVHTSADFALPNSITANVLFSFIPWLLSERFTFYLLTEHLLRVFLPLLPFILVWTLAPGPLIYKLRALVPGEMIAWLLIILGPIAYAFLPGPEVQMGNQSRYVGSAMTPMAIFVLKTLPNIKLKLRLIDYLVIALALILLSYHHRYTVLQSTPLAFLGAQLFGLSILASWMLKRRSTIFI